MSTANQFSDHKNYSEKRDFHRMTLNTEIDIKLSSGETVAAYCMNLSGTGLMFRVSEPLTEGTTGSTVIESGTDMTSDLNITLKVIRCAANGPEGYVVGAEITEFK